MKADPHSPEGWGQARPDSCPGLPGQLWQWQGVVPAPLQQELQGLLWEMAGTLRQEGSTLHLMYLNRLFASQATQGKML